MSENQRRMPRRPSTWAAGLLVPAVVMLPAGGLRSQEQPDDQPAAMTPEAAEGIEQERMATPPPGEEIMRPTSRGVRLTPRMARGLAAGFLREEVENEAGVDLPPELHERLSDRLAERMMEISAARSRDVGPFIELIYESMIGGRGKVPAATRREFARRARAALPAMRDFYDAVAGEVEPHVDAASQQALREVLDRAQRMMDRFDERMQQWSRQDAQAAGDEAEDEDGNPFEGLQDEDQPSGGVPAASRELRQVRRQARWEISRLGPEEWSTFLAQAAELLGFDSQQRARGESILREHRGRAREIMTPQWRREVEDLAVRRRLLDSLEDKNLAPYRFHLDRRWQETTGPLKETGEAFRRDVLALATAEQRARLMADIGEKAGRHGMSAAELAAASAILFGPSTGPAAPPAGGEQ